MRGLYATFYRLLRASSEVAMPLDAGDFCLMDRRVVDVINRMPDTGCSSAACGLGRAFGSGRCPTPARARRGRDQVRLRPAAEPGRQRALLVHADSAARRDLAGALLILMSGAWGSSFWRGAFSASASSGSRLRSCRAGRLRPAADPVRQRQLVLLGVLGEYVGRIYEETKGRPRWVIEATHGFEGAPGTRPDALRR